MSMLSWDDQLRVGVELMDNDHREFVELLGRLDHADDAAFGALFAELIGHTEAHFLRENALMEEAGFPALVPHRTEHARVLDEMRSMDGRLADGDVDTVRGYVHEKLPVWFLNHRNTMDFVTARFLQRPPGEADPVCGSPCMDCAES